MKLFKIIILLSILLLCATCSKITIPNEQSKVEHTIRFVTSNKTPISRCTGTAIGKSAFLTAEHCIKNLPGDPVYVMFDASVVLYAVVGQALDNRDHVILTLDRPTFTNIISAYKLLNGSTQNSPFIVYGSSSYGSTGELDKEATSLEASDVNIDLGIKYFTLPVKPGDSGAAIFDASGNVVALVTYMDDVGAIGFQLGYSREFLLTYQ